MAIKKPQIGFHVQFSLDAAQAMGTTVAVNVGDAIKHQHGGQGQAATVGREQPAFTGGNQLFVGKRFSHY